MVYPIVLFFIVSFVCVSCIIYDTLAVFVLWDREWMMPLRFIRSTNTVLFLIFYTYFHFIIGVLFVGMSAPLFEGFGWWFHYDTVCADFSNVISFAFGRGLAFLVMMPVILQKCGWKGVFSVDIFIVFMICRMPYGLIVAACMIFVQWLVFRKRSFYHERWFP